MQGVSGIPFNVQRLFLSVIFCIHFWPSFFCFADALKADRYDDSQFTAKVKEKPHFIMFYAPWCGHCKRLQPMWDKLAEHSSTAENQLKVAKVDCTQDTPLCAREDIKSYPTLRFFYDGNKSTYHGSRSVTDFLLFVKNKMSPEDKREQKFQEDVVKEDDAESPQEMASVREMDDKTFSEVLAGGLYFVKFYAPWCPHCQQLVPVWNDLGNAYLFTGLINIVKVDCTKHRQLCEENSVDAYPMLAVYHKGTKVTEYTGDRTYESLVDFVEKMVKQYKPSESIVEGTEPTTEPTTEPEVEPSEQPEVAVYLNKENFELGVMSGKVFVNFYAPWCVHCQKLAPVWEQLAVKIMLEAGGIVTVAKVDCTVDEEICRKENIHSYPSLIMYFSPTHKQEYKGPRTLEDLFAFARGVSRDEL